MTPQQLWAAPSDLIADWQWYVDQFLAGELTVSGRPEPGLAQNWVQWAAGRLEDDL